MLRFLGSTHGNDIRFRVMVDSRLFSRRWMGNRTGMSMTMVFCWEETYSAKQLYLPSLYCAVSMLVQPPSVSEFYLVTTLSASPISTSHKYPPPFVTLGIPCFQSFYPRTLCLLSSHDGGVFSQVLIHKTIEILRLVRFEKLLERIAFSPRANAEVFTQSIDILSSTMFSIISAPQASCSKQTKPTRNKSHLPARNHTENKGISRLD